MMPRFLIEWFFKPGRYYSRIVLTAGICGVLAMMALLFLLQPNSGTLADFVWSRSFRIPEIQKNLSGITYSPESETLFLVSNGPARIYEITPKGRLIRQIDLIGFYDTEDIVFVEKQTFAVVEEKRKTVVVFEIAPTAKAVQYANCRHIQALPPEGVNKGLEGLAWDPVLRTFLISQENNPRAVYTIPYDARGDAREVPSLHELPWIKLGCYSGIFFDSVSRRLLILSRRSAKIKDYSLEGQEKGSLNLFRSMPGIIRTEGLTVVPGGDLYVCSEPNRVDVFTRTQRTTEMRLLPSGDRVDIADNESVQRYPAGVERPRN